MNYFGKILEFLPNLQKKLMSNLDIVIVVFIKMIKFKYFWSDYWIHGKCLYYQF